MRRTTVRRRFVTPLSCSLVALMLLVSVCPARGRISARRTENPEPRPAVPNFTGFFDVGSCDGIAGWAADLNNLNTPIHVSVFDGPTLLTNVLANVSRPDVGAVIGDNGLHGFNIATPSILKDGLAHLVEVRFESTTTNLINSPRSITCLTTPRDDVGTGVTLAVDLKLNNGAASTKSRLLGLNFTARELSGPASRDVTGEVTHYRVREVSDSKPVNLFPQTHAGDLSEQPWLPREHALIQELALRNGLGKRYGERRILFQVKTAHLTSDVASDTILLEPVLKEYLVSASGNTHPLIQYAASQGFQFPLDYYETCKGQCAGNFIADPALDSGSAAVAVQALISGGDQGGQPFLCVLVSVVTLGSVHLDCHPDPAKASGSAGTCTTKADYLLFEGRSPNQFWRIKSVTVSNAYVVSHGANRFRAKFSLAYKDTNCPPPSLVSVGDVTVEGPEVDDFVDAAKPWKNAFVRP